MQSTATNGASGKETGNLEHFRVQYIRRRTELARRMAEAANRSLAGAYLKAIKELDEEWQEATGTPPPEFPRPAAPEPPAPGTPAHTEKPVVTVTGQGAPPESHHTTSDKSGPESSPSRPVKVAGPEAPAKQAPALVPKKAARRRWSPSKSQVMLLLAGVPVLAWLITGVVWVGQAGSGRIIRNGIAVRAAVGPLALKWPWPIEQFQPADPLDTIDDAIVNDPRLAAADAEAARRGAASIRAAYQRLRDASTSSVSDESRAEDLMRRAAKAPKNEAGALYRKAAVEFIRAISVEAAGNAQVAVERWDTVPPADRLRWQPRIAQAAAKLDEGRRLFADGRDDEARQVLMSSSAALETIWNEYMAGLVTTARSALTVAIAEWDLAMQTLVKAGMADPEPILLARASIARDDKQNSGQAYLDELRAAHASVVAATAQFREEQSEFLASRQAAEQAIEAFRQSKKAAFPPDVSQADALMDRAVQTLRSQGPRSAALVYRQAADEYTGAVALAAAGLAAQAQTQKLAASAELLALRRSIDALSETRAAAFRRASKAAGRLQELRAGSSSQVPGQEGMVREQIAAAEIELALADRVTALLDRAGVTEASLSALEESFRSVRQTMEQAAGTPAIPGEIVAQTARLGQLIGLVETAVLAESAAHASARRWESLPPQSLERWKDWLQGPLANVQSGVRTLDSGAIEEGTHALEAARRSLDSIWAELLAEAARDARQKAETALGQWNALIEPLAKLAPREPDEVREAKSLLESASSSATPADQRVEMLRRATSLLLSAVATGKEQRAAVNVLGPDGRTALRRAVDEGDAVAVESLLGRGADPNIPGNDREAALVVAVRAGRADLAWMLLAAGAERAPVAADGTPLVFLSAHSPATLQLFLDDAGPTRYRGSSVLHEIARAGMEHKVKGPDQVKLAGMVLDKFPALLRQKDGRGLTALELARQRDASELVLFLTLRESK